MAVRAIDIFKSELGARYKNWTPPEAIVAELQSYLDIQRLPQVPDGARDDFIRDIGRPLYQEFRCKAHQARNALRSLRDSMPSNEWAVLADRNEGLQDVLDALGKMGSALDPLPAIRPAAGRPPEQDLHLLGATLAELIGEALSAPGAPSARVSMTSDRGPVARIGAKFAAAILGRNIVSPATFAEWVRQSKQAK